LFAGRSQEARPGRRRFRGHALRLNPCRARRHVRRLGGSGQTGTQDTRPRNRCARGLGRKVVIDAITPVRYRPVDRSEKVVERSLAL
jgi:hypothetical protein